MKVIILAAGSGTRLSPLTNDKPKCMVKLFGKSLLERQIEVFREIGITDISVVTGYKKELIVFDNIKFYHNHDFKNTNMVETLFSAEKELFGDVIVSYGDIIFQKNIVEKLIKSNDDFSVIIDKEWKKYWDIRFENPLDDAESLVLDSENCIKEIGQKTSDFQKIQGQYIGLMMFREPATKTIKEFYKKTQEISREENNPLNPNIPFRLSYMTDFLQGLINKKHKLKAVLIENGWLELDSMQDYTTYNKLYEQKTLSNFIKIEEKSKK